MRTPRLLGLPMLPPGRATTNTAAWCLLLAMALYAPLVRGGNRPVPLLVLELLALAALCVVLFPAALRRRIPATAGIVAGLVASIPLLGLLPLPSALWNALPGRAALAIALPAEASSDTWHTLSIAPGATEYSGLALLPPIAAFLLVACLKAQRIRTLCVVIALVAALEAILGLLQYGAAGGELAGFRASGTYVNPNHFAGLMLLGLPLALMALALEAGERARGHAFATGLRHVLRHLAAARGTRVMLWLGVCVLCVLALLFSRSRAGIVLGALGIVLTALIAAPRIGGARAYGTLGLGLTLAVGLAVVIGLAPVLERFAQNDAVSDNRVAIVGGALAMAATYLPFGAGMGTFATLYPPFQPQGITTFVHHAHNDYVEWITEGGLLAGVAILAAFTLYALRMLALLRTPNRDATNCMQLAAGVAVALLALHGLVDFNLRIPANALLFAMLAGVMVARHVGATAPRGPQVGVAGLPDMNQAPTQHGAPRAATVISAAQEIDMVRAVWGKPCTTPAMQAHMGESSLRSKARDPHGNTQEQASNGYHPHAPDQP